MQPGSPAAPPGLRPAHGVAVEAVGSNDAHRAIAERAPAFLNGHPKSVTGTCGQEFRSRRVSPSGFSASRAGVPRPLASGEEGREGDADQADRERNRSEMRSGRDYVAAGTTALITQLPLPLERS